VSGGHAAHTPPTQASASARVNQDGVNCFFLSYFLEKNYSANFEI
jgi:hypothetical protein